MGGKVGFLGEAVEMLQEEAEKGLTTAKQQITGKKKGQQAAGGQSQTQQQPQGQNPPQDQASKPAEEATSQNPQTDQTDDFVKELYGSEQAPLTEDEIKKKELDDKQKAEALAQRLHSEYYERLVNPPKPKEERPAEKIEREEEEKKQGALQEEEKKKKEELPLITTKNMGTAEKLRGVSG